MNIRVCKIPSEGKLLYNHPLCIFISRIYIYIYIYIYIWVCVCVSSLLNMSWRQHPTKHLLYGHLPPITKTIQVRRTRHAGPCWRSRNELIIDVLLWTPTYGWAKAGRPAWTYIQQLCEDTGCSPEDLPEAMNDREKWREMAGDIRVGGMTWWWWWWWWWYIYLAWNNLKILETDIWGKTVKKEKMKSTRATRK